MYCKFCLLGLLLLGFINFSSGQQIIKGKVIDASSREPLPFVSILYQLNPPRGIVSDINGNFTLINRENSKKLMFNYLGYKPRTISTDSVLKSDKLIIIELTSVVLELDEVVVYPGENPAHRIIRNAVENRAFNDPEKLSSYKCNVYNKLFLEPKIARDATTKDSAEYKNITSKLKGSGMLVIESLSKRKFLRPDRIEDKVIATRVSGFQDPSFTFLGTGFQPFAFYKEVITLAMINYVNPISPGSTRNYRFRLKDTIVHETDTTFIISFEPFPKKNFTALKGVLYINTNGFAIENVIAEPVKKGLFEFKIQQKYQLVNNHQWFPEQLLFEARLTKQPFVYKGNTFIREVEINPDIKASDLGMEWMTIEENAGRKDDTFWVRERADTLSRLEKLTYRTMDSLGRRYDFDSKLKIVEDLAFGEFPLGALGRSPFRIFNLDFTKVYYKNGAEGTRLGMGLKTNDNLFRFLSLGGYVGYGFKDQIWKYGTDIDFTLNKYHETHLIFSYQNTSLEPGITDFRKLLRDALNSYWGNYTISRLDRVIEYGTELNFRALKYAEFQFALKRQTRTPQYDYSFMDDAFQQSTTLCSFQTFIKYSYGERIEKVLRRRISHGTKYPTIYMTYTRGIKGLLDGELEYNRIECGLYKSFIMKKIGESKIRIEAGYVDSQVPYFLLFTADGSKDKSAPFSVRNAFQTMSRYEFVSDQYVNLFYTHNFGSVLFKIKKFRPQFSVFQSVSYGSISNPGNHQLIEIQSKEKGYFESGVGLNNLIKWSIKNYLYLGLGFETYYRWGPYAHSNEWDNAAVKLTIKASLD